MVELALVEFEKPLWLLLLLLVIPSFILARRSIGGLSARKAYLVFLFRCVLILLLTTALAHPIWEKQGKGLTVTVLLDRSLSLPLPLKRQAVEFLEAVSPVDEREEDDQLGVITIAKQANIAAMPDHFTQVRPGSDPNDLTATNLADGISLALALMPHDTANRLVLVSDGNETVNRVLSAAAIAQSNGIPIDVVPLEYEHNQEVLFERLIAPSVARYGSSANIKLVLRSQNPASGKILLSINDQRLDLNGDDPGEGLPIELDPGIRVVSLTVDMNEYGAQIIDAMFVPDDESMDGIARNNQASAVTFVHGQGRVLIIDDGTIESQHLARALAESNIEAEVLSPDAVVGGLAYYNGFDAIVLANIPRFAFDDQQDHALHDYVHDFGGGLIMLGGPQSFGAGGWMDQEVAKVLPVSLDPPQTRQMMRGALALIMHSCEMPQGNFWGQKVAESAIKALSSLDYAGIVEFSWGGGRPNSIEGCSWAYPMSVVGDKQAALQACKTMTVGDMPAFGPSLQVALKSLTDVPAGQKHIIIISDGDPSPPSKALLQKIVDAQITVTTVMVGGHGTAYDRNNMKAVANITGGRFYDVKNPKNLPEIFFKEARVVSRSLIQEGDIYQPQFVSLLPGPTKGFSSVPSLDGYVLTATREGLAQVPLAVTGEQDGQPISDPIYAYWNYGLGRSIAFTSDITGRWGSRWAGWEQFRAFWEQSIRWAMRPASSTNVVITTHEEGDRAVVEIEALQQDNATFLNFLQMRAKVHRPQGDSETLPLQQIGPGRYRGEFNIDEAGTYLVGAHYLGGSTEKPIQGHLQAAVCVPYAQEFRAMKHNRALLENLAQLTGGRVLMPGDPALVTMFEHEGLELPMSPQLMWDLLTIIAAALFILDVAARRLTIDPHRVAAWFSRAVGKRAEKTEDTVAAWKRARRQVKHQQDTVTQQRKRKFDAEDAAEDVKIDVGSETSAMPKTKPVVPRRAASEPEPKLTEEDDMTSRLLAARRRAQQESESDQDTSTQDKSDA